MKYTVLCIFLLFISCCYSWHHNQHFKISNKVLPPQLNETVKCLNEYIATFQSKMVSFLSNFQNPQLYKIFKNTFPNTLSTTVQHFDLTPGKQYTYIITGDIEAMWLRDSTNQFLPYLTMQKPCPHIQSLAKGLLNAQAKFIMTDPYTNAFKKFEEDVKKRPSYLNDKTEKLIMGIPVDLCLKKQYATKSIWERKYQIDSLASFMRLTYEYYQKYQETDFFGIIHIKALRRIITTLNQQIKDRAYQKQMGQNFYTFFRDSRELPNGTIAESFHTGMIKTGFRPSDDANALPYNIPGNAMMASFMELVANKVLSKIQKQSVFYTESQKIKHQLLFFVNSIRAGIESHGVVQNEGKTVYAYQVNGKGDFRLYDDANLPSILSMPYMGYTQANQTVYKNSRQYILSSKNPFYFENGDLKGVGSSHTKRDFVWPLALITQALTSSDTAQIKNCLYNLKTSAANDLMHQSFNIKAPKQITRDWFAWANSFFGELIVTLEKTHPELLK